MGERLRLRLLLSRLVLRSPLLVLLSRLLRLNLHIRINIKQATVLRNYVIMCTGLLKTFIHCQVNMITISPLLGARHANLECLARNLKT